MTRIARGLALASLVLLLLVVGAALRPLVIPERSGAGPVLDDVEVGFVQDMAAHHQQALAMVNRLAPDVDPTVAALARQIGDAQRIEIGTLQGWLRLAEAAPTNPTPMNWMVEGAGHRHDAVSTGPGVAMPGMATTAELDGLSSAHGRDAEVLFLQLMERHHAGGVEMARAADRLLTGGPVKEVARGAMQSQSQEAGLMGVMLAQRGASTTQ
ncbi:DUF305 domain-containing protein [Rhodococcus triatomae]|nr:hypothetical protein G419_17846 [Rhodococcus triatomae BKS 15-14]